MNRNDGAYSCSYSANQLKNHAYPLGLCRLMGSPHMGVLSVGHCWAKLPWTLLGKLGANPGAAVCCLGQLTRQQWECIRQQRRLFSLSINQRSINYVLPNLVMSPTRTKHDNKFRFCRGVAHIYQVSSLSLQSIAICQSCDACVGSSIVQNMMQLPTHDANTHTIIQ